MWSAIWLAVAVHGKTFSLSLTWVFSLSLPLSNFQSNIFQIPHVDECRWPPSSFTRLPTYFTSIPVSMTLTAWGLTLFQGHTHSISITTVWVSHSHTHSNGEITLKKSNWKLYFLIKFLSDLIAFGEGISIQNKLHFVHFLFFLCHDYGSISKVILDN